MLRGIVRRQEVAIVDDSSLIDPGDSKSKLEMNLKSNSCLEMGCLDSK